MAELKDRYIRFDWAIKRLLRQKANFGVLEGFLTVFLNEEVKIIDILESEGNQSAADDKFNRVDIKAKNSKGEIIIVETILSGACAIWCSQGYHGTHQPGQQLQGGEEGVFHQHSLL